MYFEIFKGGKLVKRGKQILGGLDWSNELMYTPSCKFSLPIEYTDYMSGREDFLIYVNDKCFHGIVMSLVEDKENEVVEVGLEHVIHEWTYRQISVNHAVKDGNVNIVYKGSSVGDANGEWVSANPFTVYESEFDEFSDEQFIKRAGAVAWNKTEQIPIKYVTYIVDTDEHGEPNYSVYWVTFQTEGGAKVTVRCSVQKDPGDKISSGKYSAVWVAEEDMKALTDEVGDKEAVVDTLMDIFADGNFAYEGWVLNMSQKAQDTGIDYVYSRQDKLSALTKTMENTEDIFWRVRFIPDRILDIGEFGEQKPYIVSKKPSGPNNIRILTEPTVDLNFEHVINLATVYSEKSDTGMSSMTLREVYNDPSLQKSGFPCIILRANVNNERDYRAYSTQYPSLAPNNELEYAVLDEESVALEGGHLIEGTYAFNDLSPFAEEVGEDGKTKEVTDEDRIKAAQVAYNKVVRKLIQARRHLKINVTVEEIPSDINVGDKVRFIYDNSIFKLEACTSYMKKILSLDDWFYITAINYSIAENGAETDELTLEKYLYTDREITNED